MPLYHFFVILARQTAAYFTFFIAFRAMKNSTVTITAGTPKYNATIPGGVK